MEEILMKFMDQINAALRHSNPQVRKEAEKLFKAIYVELGA
jgi:vesicle coat complex subunit